MREAAKEAGAKVQNPGTEGWLSRDGDLPGSSAIGRKGTQGQCIITTKCSCRPEVGAKAMSQRAPPGPAGVGEGLVLPGSLSQCPCLPISTWDQLAQA